MSITGYRTITPVLTVEIWALHVPTGPVAVCAGWDLGEDIARALSRAGGTYRVTAQGSASRAEFTGGQRTPGPYEF